MADTTITFAGRASRPGDRYQPVQIVLHWTVVAMILSQWLTSGAIHRTHNPLVPASTFDHILHSLHNYVGMAIGVLIAIRVLMKFALPPLRRANSPNWQVRGASLVHWGLYGALLGQAGAGFTAAYLWAGAGRIHVFLWNVTLLLIALHLAAAAFHLVRRDGTVSRMIPLRR